MQWPLQYTTRSMLILTPDRHPREIALPARNFRDDGRRHKCNEAQPSARFRQLGQSGWKLRRRVRTFRK